MDPSLQPTPPPPSDPYAFLNESKHSNSLALNLGNLSGRGKILFAVVAIVVLLVIVVAAKSLFSGNKSFNLPSLTLVLSEQQELSNLANSGIQQSQVMSQTYLNFSYTTLASVTTDQTKLNKLLTYNNVKISSNSYVLQPNVDAKLQQAQQTSTFDTVYATVMQQQLGYYKNDLSQAYNLNQSPIVRSYLKTDYNDTLVLIKMLGSSYG